MLTKPLFAALLLCAAKGTVHAQGWLPDPNIEVRNAVAPIYLEARPEPAAILRADRVATEYQRRGFFRIGALPMLVMDGLSLEFLDSNRFSNVLSSASARLSGAGEMKKPVEGRNLRVWFAPDTERRLTAQRVRLENGFTWRLHDGGIIQNGAVVIPFSEATLAVAGADIGELVCKSPAGVVHTNLLSVLSAKPNHSLHENPIDPGVGCSPVEPGLSGANGR
jgi:hypothetical protein